MLRAVVPRPALAPRRPSRDVSRPVPARVAIARRARRAEVRDSAQSTSTALAAVDAAGEGEIAPLLRARLDVDAVDPHSRGTEEAKLDRRVRVGDLDESNLGLDPQLRCEPLDERPRRLVVRAAVEIEDLHA